MKKLLLIISVFVGSILTITIGWIVLFPSQSAPIVDQFQNYLPFGSGENLPPPEDSDKGAFGEFSEEDYSATDARSKLFQISKEPIAGFEIISSTSSVSVRYAERSTGHIYDFNLYTLEKRRVTNQTIPKVYEAIFSKDGSKVVYRQLKEDDETIQNTSLTLTPPITTSSSTEEFYNTTITALRIDMDEIISGPNNTLYYILKNDSAIVSSNFEGGEVKVLYQSPFNSWKLSLHKNNLLIWTKPSANSLNFAYLLNTNGSLTKILGPYINLVINPSPYEEEFTYSFTEDGVTRMFSTLTGSVDNSEINPATFPEKCGWGRRVLGQIFCGIPVTSGGDLGLDGWYKGTFHFSDSIWRFDTTTTEGRIEVIPKDLLGVDIDVMRPQVSPDDDYFVFINKYDLSLWALRIE